MYWIDFFVAGEARGGKGVFGKENCLKAINDFMRRNDDGNPDTRVILKESNAGTEVKLWCCDCIEYRLGPGPNSNPFTTTT